MSVGSSESKPGSVCDGDVQPAAQSDVIASNGDVGAEVKGPDTEDWAKIVNGRRKVATLQSNTF